MQGEIKLYSLFLVFLVAVSLFSFNVFAQESEDLEEIVADTGDLETEIDVISAGTTPDSALWGIDVALDNIRLRLARDKEAVGLKIAQERLEEIKEMSVEGKIQESQEAAIRHEEALTRIRARIDSLGDGEEDLRKSVRVERAIAKHNEEISELRERISNLTPAQRERIFAFLNSLEENSEKVRLKVEEKQEDALLRIEQRTGMSLIEIRDRLGRLKERKSIRAEVFDDVSLVKVDYRFEHRFSGENASIEDLDLIQKIIDDFATSAEEANALLKIERDDDEDEHDEVHELEEDVNERLKIKIDTREKDDEVRAKVFVQLRFADGVDRESIVNEIAERTQLTREDILSVAQIKERTDRETEEDEDEREIEIEVKRLGVREVAFIELEWDGLKIKFRLPISDRDEIVSTIANRLGVSVEEVNAAIKEFEVKDKYEDDGDDKEFQTDEDDFDDEDEREHDEGKDDDKIELEEKDNENNTDNSGSINRESTEGIADNSGKGNSDDY